MDIVQDLVIAVGKIEMVDFDRGAISRRGRQWRGLIRCELRSGFGHFEETYHDRRLRLRSRNTIEVSAMSMTRKRKTNAAPYWTRSVYSFCGIFELTT